MKKGIVLVVIAALGMGCWYGMNSRNNESIPELTCYVETTDEDSDNTVVIEDEEVPLASPKVTTKTTTKTTKKTVKLKKAAKKTYKVTKPSTTKTTTKTTKKTTQTVTVKTTKVTTITESYTKKSKSKVVTTKVKTTVRTTTTPVSTAKSSTTTTTKATTSTTKSSTTTTKAETTAATTTQAETTAAVLQTVSINEIALAKKADKKLVNAYETLGFTVTIDSSVSYSGYFTARLRSITLKRNDDTIYHELGHFLAFIAGNVDKKSDFTAVYNEEKSKFTGINKAYSTQNSSEYFAESYKNYVENPSELKKTRPKTYESIKQALNVITDEHIKRVQTVYAPFWK
jgi:hypothetical protein